MKGELMGISKDPDQVPVTFDLRQAVRESQRLWNTEHGERVFESVHEILYPMAFRYALGLLGNKEDAEEVASWTLWNVWRRLPDFDEERASFKTWVTHIAHKVALDHLRRTFQARKHFVGLSDRTDAESRPDTPDERMDLETMYRSLSPELRMLLEARFVDDQTIADVAILLEVSPRWVNNRIRELRAQLQRLRR